MGEQNEADVARTRAKRVALFERLVQTGALTVEVIPDVKRIRFPARPATGFAPVRIIRTICLDCGGEITVRWCRGDRPRLWEGTAHAC